MRDFSTGHRKSPQGFDRILMAVAATFLSVAATTANAQSGPAKSPADLAIDAAVPLPEPANVPPPTVNDFKADTTAAATPPKKEEAAAPAAPATTATVPPAATAPTATPPAATAAAPAVEPPKTEPAKAAPAVAAADQPVADKLRDLIAAKGARYFDRKNERTAVENFYKDRNYAPLWSEAGAAWQVAGALLYLIGSIGVTMVCNVPLNNRLANLAPESAEGATFWTQYLSVWTAWNHVRTLACLGSSVCFILGIA